MGTLYIVVTPIGNLEDLSSRALKILRSVPVIIAEDTRHTGVLLKHFEIENKKFISLYDEVEEQKTPEIIELLKENMDCALVSDAGTPLVADPGYKFIQACIHAGITIVPIPGPSAVITALVASGMPPDRFAFLGYFPLKKGKQETILTQIKESKENGFIKTFIFYESPHRLLISLKIIQESLGDIPIVIAREMTKIHEEFFRGSISEAQEHFKNPKGEFVMVL